MLTFVLPGLWVLAMVVFLLLPESMFHRSRLKGVYSPKVMTLMRITFISLVNSGPRVDDLPDRAVGGPELHRPVDRADWASRWR